MYECLYMRMYVSPPPSGTMQATLKNPCKQGHMCFLTQHGATAYLFEHPLGGGGLPLRVNFVGRPKTKEFFFGRLRRQKNSGACGAT